MGTPNHYQQTGFTLVEMIMVIVITGIIGGIVAMFLKAPIQQYMDVARRAELTDIADTAVRRMARDVRTAVPNSVRPQGQSTYVEFLPTRDGGRYRANAPGTSNCGGAGDALSFAPDVTVADTCFEVIGPAMSGVAGHYLVVGSTQSDADPPYRGNSNGVLRQITGASGVAGILLASSGVLPAFAQLDSQRFQVVDGTQQAVTYACVGMQGGALDANQNGQGKLMRYWGYGFQSTQVAPPTVVGGSDGIGALTPSSAILADKVRACEITYEVPNQRFGLLAVRLTLTSNNESVTLYNEIHVNNAP